MNQEIRMKTKHFYAVLVILGFLLIYSLSSNRGCDSTEQAALELQSLQDNRAAFIPNHKGPTIYAITPTYARPVQKAELTRLSHVIRLVPNVFWVIVEDAEHTSNLVTNLLMRSGLQDRSVQLSAKTPTNFKLQGKDPNWLKPRGVEQRNKALEWVRQHMADNGGRERHAVVYFMDDDNTNVPHCF